MAKGAIAKTEVIKRIQSAFGTDYIGEFDKKVYVYANENGEKIQIAISLTCPKVPVACAAAPVVNDNGDWDFESSSSVVSTATAFEPAEITDEERENVAALMERLGL